MTASKPPRQHKTARQRAEEALGVAQRRVDRLTKEKARRQGDLNKVVTELEQAAQRLAYAKRDPALPEQPTTGRTDQSGDTA